MANFNFGEVILNAYLKSQADVKEQERYSQEAQFRERQFQTQVEQYNDNKEFQKSKFEWEKQVQDYQTTMGEARLLLEQEQSDIANQTSKRAGAQADLNKKVTLEGIRQMYSQNAYGLGIKGIKAGDIEKQFGEDIFTDDNQILYPSKDIKEGLDIKSARQQSGALEEARRRDTAMKDVQMGEMGYIWNGSTYVKSPTTSIPASNSNLGGIVDRVLTKQSMSEEPDMTQILFGDILNKKIPGGFTPSITPNYGVVPGFNTESAKAFARPVSQESEITAAIGQRMEHLITPAKEQLSYLEALIRKPKLTNAETQTILPALKNLEYMLGTTAPMNTKGEKIGQDVPSLLSNAYNTAAGLGYEDKKKAVDIVNLQRRLAVISSQLKGNKR